ncbi:MULTISPECIES: glycosyltransferase [Burkholderia]|uniref:Glycosyl transferase n=1 Tax=Burkholderia contaminans TaxID=488447 RepID=A0A2S5E423_9BURK|nr:MULTISPECIES: glycosyltransferase [Burkholderia]EKS9798726.1 glycosyltransferase [Burkholderia cepacia]EKS9803182.1 glycosyltransferase [Burkholderia cepacia]EKS9808594.1 glycosyltransferase [Burkholderia cepacia]EKS9810666.1 glycosyltransferase [Burkholderia cepacia]EKS9819603.1 glycosyltransferase [Burkholderia cepacia]
MKILVVTNMYLGSNRASPWQGVFVTEQVEALRRSGGCTVDVLVIEGYRDRREYLRSIGHVWKAARAGRYDVVHYHFGLSACSAPLVRLFTRARVVITFHGTDILGPLWMRAVSKSMACFAHACIGVSAEISARLRGRRRRCETIPCAVDETVFFAHRDDARTESTAPIVVFPSSPKRPEKNYPLFAQVLRQLSAQHGIEVQERHIDGLDRGEVRDLLARAACLLMTSTREGSPQSVKEAMALGLPVVSVDVGNVRHLLDGLSPGMVVFDHDAGRLTHELADVLKNGTRSDGRARLAALGYFSAEVSAKLKTLYASLHRPSRFVGEGADSDKPDGEVTQ